MRKPREHERIRRLLRIGRHAPHADAIVRTRRRKPLPIRTPRDCKLLLPRLAQRVAPLAACDIPQLHRAIRTRACDQFSIGTKRQREHRAVVPVQSLPLRRIRDIPQLGLLIIAPRRQRLPIRRKRERVNHVAMPRESARHFRARDIPLPHLALDRILAGCRKKLRAIRRPHERVHRAAMPVELLHRKLRDRVHEFHRAPAPDRHELRLRRKCERIHRRARRDFRRDLRKLHDLAAHLALRRLCARINPLHKFLHLVRRQLVALSRRHESFLPVLRHLAAQIFHQQALRRFPRDERRTALAALQNVRMFLQHQLAIRIIRRVAVETPVLDQLRDRREIIRLLRTQRNHEGEQWEENAQLHAR